MKRVLQIYVLSCFLIVSPSAAFAQNKRVRIAPQQQPPGQLEAQIKASLKLINGEQYELAYQQAKRALVMSQRRGDKGRQARAANLLAIAALHLGRTNEAIGYFKQASGVADEARSEQVRKIELTGLDRAGQLLRVSGRYDDALFCFQRTLQLYHQQNNRQGEALMLSRLGAIYSDTGDFAKADQQLQEALTIARALSDKDLEATVLV